MSTLSHRTLFCTFCKCSQVQQAFFITLENAGVAHSVSHCLMLARLSTEDVEHREPGPGRYGDGVPGLALVAEHPPVPADQAHPGDHPPVHVVDPVFVKRLAQG